MDIDNGAALKEQLPNEILIHLGV